MFQKIKNFVTKHKRLTIGVVLLLVVIFVFTRLTNRSQAPTYQTAIAEKKTLISTVTASGTVVATNNIYVTSSANGQVSKVYVSEGDKVVKGQKLFEITLDATGHQRQAQAYGSYISAISSLNQAKASYYTLQATEFSANQKFINDAVARNLGTNDPTYIQENATWLAAEANFNNAGNEIAQAEANLTNAQITYSQASSTIVAPVGGIIENITIVPGMSITNSTTSNSGSTSTNTTTVATIKTEGNPVATVNIAEIDVAKVKAKQKVTLTFDSITGLTFTGKVAGINKLGTTNSGVTNYPATIEFDSSSDKILPAMSVTASIITNVKDNVITVPSGAVTTQNGQTAVRELKNGELTFISVTIGEKSDTDTEILEGVNEGDTVVTSIINANTRAGSNSTSPFSGQFGRGGFGGGGNVRVLTR